MAYDLLKKLARSVYEGNPQLQDNYRSVPAIEIKEIVDRICGEYQNPRNIDKVGVAQQEVSKAAAIMQKNVEGRIKNIQDADVLNFPFDLYRNSRNKAKALETTQTSSWRDLRKLKMKWKREIED